MAGRLEGKVAVVTGAGRNIGRAEAMLLAEQGARVVVNDLGGGPYGTEAADASLAEAIAKEIRDAGGEAIGQCSSVATREGAEATVQAAIDQWGRIDILVNNAGIVRPARIDRMTDDDWQLCVDVSLTATFHTCRAAARHMIGQRSGAIVNTGSPSGFGHWGMANYSAAKEGVLGLTRSIARDLGEFGVRCNMIRPVSHLTGTHTPEIDETIAESARLGIPLLWNKPMAAPRMTALPEHVAALVVWLCTDAAGHVSGRDFYIQGDEVALIPEPEAIRTSFHPGGWTLDAFDEEANRAYLFGDIPNRFVRRD
ncbi:SDR family NAD(P)-dependent oxidoreductase [Sphingomonas histidinilytica]|uniref:NAD(P)-dependent dehydrogenase, short-chain alcohol dehydrogenase family n=1 Tax=Rhizorhabdus histidinilytica TaxID=439228 RepID=A0A1T5A528_9SPHN|nr:SDR family NAD(P)-dependent oxidoreductase [Rhizorhabdus histidinilytica]MBO9376200.1 SDR family NAD(P)-dependent oxidoreductase [Rhizorhabdus histidinilytica]QEH78246.1 SDR family oxidoreductase [Sphingomonas sp. C8-2]SKB30015.1 NAD(P)-dependent dehydrogenase, short-chain alcohol dehydrogenase family [Rhizorhabdus histidinilytica]